MEVYIAVYQVTKWKNEDDAPKRNACIGPDDKTLDERIGYYCEKIVFFTQTWF